MKRSRRSRGYRKRSRQRLTCTITMPPGCSTSTSMGPRAMDSVQNAKTQTREAVLDKESAWHHTAWAYTRSLSLEATLLILQKVLTSGAAQALSNEHVTVPVLDQLLPKYNRYRHQNSTVIYVIIGKHINGNWALYPGSSARPVARIAAHRQALASVRRNGTRKDVQEVHRVLGKPGWSINIRILCEMDTTVSFIWKLWIETISIIFLRSLDLTTRSAYQNSHVVILAASLEPVPQVGAVEPTRLNRCLPIYQGFFSGGGAQMKTARTQKCYWCGGSLAEKYFRVPDDKTLTKYQCRKCYEYPARRTFDPEIVAARPKENSFTPS